MVVGSIISIIFTYYCDENKRNKVKLSVYLLFGGVYFEQCNQKNMLGNTRASARNAW